MKSIHVSIFCDESKDRKIESTSYTDSENWNYIGICIVPTSNINSLSYKLNNCRCGSDEKNNYMECVKNCKYHNGNKKKIHFTDSQNGYIYKTAVKWTNIILNNHIDKEFYINILGIDYCKLDKRYFKNSSSKTDIDGNIYCRFFRTAILFSIKSFFSEYDMVFVDNIYHDIGNMEHHKFFKRQVINYVNKNEDKIKMNCEEISFISTTNENCLEDENVFLQLIDIFLGEAINLIHSDAKNEKKKELSLMLFPIVDHCLNRPNNINSKYHKLYNISFFPKYLINDDMDELEKKLKVYDNFFNKREIRLSEGGEQLKLF